MSPITVATPVRQRILDAAFELFYRQGYRATGINQVIAESGVAKASFYDHFPSKDDLLCAYIQEMARREMADLQAHLATLRTPRQRFFGLMNMIVPWMEATGYRGCPFQNIVAEAPPDDPRVRRIVSEHRQNVRRLLADLAREMLRERSKPGRVDPDELAATYQLLLEGAIALAATHREPWPVEHAIKELESRLKPR